MFGTVFGIETPSELREELQERPREEELIVVVREEDGFEPCELDFHDFFGEVDEADRVSRSVSQPQPVWRAKLIPVVLWAALWYERIEHAARRMVVTSCQVAERLLGCNE